MEQDILTPQPKKIYKTNSFTYATLIGGPLAAAYMASNNYKNLGESHKSKYAWLVAIGFLFLLVGFSMLPPFQSVPALAYNLLGLMITQILVHFFQAKAIRQHIENGGEAYPVSRAVAIGLVSAIIVLAVLLGLFYLEDQL